MTEQNLHIMLSGVVKDFHFKSFHEPISPLVMVLNNNSENIIVKTKTKDIAGLLHTMKKNWTDLKAEVPFSYSFLDERFDNTYQSEQKIGQILGHFCRALLFSSLVLACLVWQLLLLNNELKKLVSGKY